MPVFLLFDCCIMCSMKPVCKLAMESLMKPLKTAEINGYFEFTSNLICLSKYSRQNKQEIEAWVNELKVERGWRQSFEARSLLTHEFTHFLDMTTTVWGLEYVCRKLLMLNPQGGFSPEEAARVYMVNTLEIEVHDELVSKPNSSIDGFDSLSHGLKYTEKYGVVCLLFYSRGGEVVHQAPISMLSVLEANATANEYLRRLSDADYLEASVAQVEVCEIEREVLSLLRDSSLTEYTLLITLTKTHFPELPLWCLLKFVSALSRFTLDVGAMCMSSMADVIEDTFSAALLGNWVCVDLRRGGSRPIIFLKTILLMYSSLSDMEGKAQSDFIETIIDNPFEAIVNFWQGMGVEVLQALSDSEYDCYHKSVLDSESCIDYEIVRSGKSNRDVLKNSHAGLTPFGELALVDPITEDGSVISMPNRINVDVLDYFEANLATFLELDEVYDSTPKLRFHMSPEEAFHFRVGASMKFGERG